MAKQVDFMDGANSSTTPTIGNVDTTNLACYADDAAYEAANAGAPTEGNIYCNTTDNTIHYYNGTAWTELADDDTAQTFTNKTIDGTATGTNTVTIDASDAEFDNTVSGLTATDVKAAIDEVEGRVDTAETDITTAQGSADANTTDISDIRTTQGTSDGDTDMGTFTGTTLTDNTDVKTLLQELETAVEAVGGALVFAGTWNANTNTPTLSDGTGTAGEFYIVSVAGTTSLDGISDWAVNDWAIFDGTVWRKIDNSELVTSVNGQTGNAVLDINDIDDVNTGGVGARYRLQRNSLNTLWIDFNPYSNQTDATSGSNVTLSSIVEEGTKRLTSGTLVSVDMIPASFQGDSFVLLNDTGVAITLNNETGATAADQILTGSGGPIVLKDGASIGMIYDANISVQKWRLIGGPGGGTGGVSGIITGDDSTADTTAGDWATYADAADTIPVDGTGGSPNITLARTTVSTEILQGAGSFEITKGAFNRQGEGVSLDIAAPKYIRGQASQISFSYDATDAGGAVVHTDEFLTTDTTLAFGADFIGQTFLTTAAYTPNKVGMILHKNGLTPTGNYQLHLYATSGGVPTGSPIASTALLDAAALPSTASGIQSFNLVTPVALTDATTYAIVIEEISLVGNINVDRTGASVYPSGGRVTSADGITWGGPFTGDYAFSISEDTTVGFDFGNPADPVGSPSDMSVFLYDVTNSKLLVPSETGIFGGGLFRANVQIPSDCEDVRVIFHIATTSALAYDFVFDRVELDVAPSEFITRANSVETKTLSGDVTADTTLTDLTFDNLKIGTYYRANLNATILHVSNTGTLRVRFNHDSNTIALYEYDSPSLDNNDRLNTTTSVIFKATNNELTFTTEHSGVTNVLVGNGTQAETFAQLETLNDFEDVEVAAASGLNAQAVMRAYKNGGAIGASTAIPSWTGVDKDSVGAFNATTGVYTVKSPGDYWVSASVQVTVPTADGISIYLNGSVFSQVESNSSSVVQSTSGLLTNLKYGDTIDLRQSSARTVESNDFGTQMSIHKIGSEQQPYAPRVAYLKDVKAAATNGGTFTSGAWQTRDLNTVEGDASFVSLSANQFTLQPGTYDIESASPALSVNAHKAKLRDITNTVDTIIGHSAWASNTNVVGNLATITGRFTITAATTFEIQHRCEITSATFGFGADSNFGVDEVYTQVKITKVL